MLGELKFGVQRSNQAFSELTTTLQDNMALLCSLSSGAIDRRHFEVDLGSMRAYLQSIVRGGGWPSDLDIWECIWNVVQTVDLFILSTS